MTQQHGKPCWYELMVPQGDLPKASEFYTRVFGWQVSDSVMEEFSYHLARAGEQMVAGLMNLPDPTVPPNWLFYTTVNDCDATAENVAGAGGQVLMEPQDVPETGRFAVLQDPQGAVFGVLEPAPMQTPPEGSAFDKDKPGHGSWHELMTTDPKAALSFYSSLFGWTAGPLLPMGADGDYQIFNYGDEGIGGMCGMMDARVPYWMPYFRAEAIAEICEAITGAGGAILHGPVEVPGGVQIAIARDPSGAAFGVTAPN